MSREFHLTDSQHAMYMEYRGADYQLARVSAQYSNLYQVLTSDGEWMAEVAGRLRYRIQSRSNLPAVGDFVLVSVRPSDGRATIHHVLARKSQLQRQAAGLETEEQVLAANVDTVFIVMSLNRDFNLSRLERYLLLTWNSGATPVVVLSKADICDDVESKLWETQAVAPGVPVHTVSTLMPESLEPLHTYVTAGQTVVFLGSSGVGKSSLVNLLAGIAVLQVGEVRDDDDKGRHTTTHRQLIELRQGAWVIDTPGMRELQLWDGSTDLGATFADIEQLKHTCRFRDCTHRSEPGCAVQAAIQSGDLDEKRLSNYLKLGKELAFQARKEAQKQRMMTRRQGRK